jgi:hypothetical protein
MNSLKKLFTSLFGLSKKNKNRGKKRSNKHHTRKNKTHRKGMRGG